MRTVLFPHTSPLLLERVQRNPDGTIKTGSVVNGGWRFEVRDGECLAKDGRGAIVNRWPKPADMPEVVVPDNWRGDYNEIIARAQRTAQPPSPPTNQP